MVTSVDGYLTDLGRVLGIGGAFASIPLLASLASLQPPWPPALAYVSAALVLLAALISWEWTRRNRLRTRRVWISLGAALCLAGLFVYLPLYSSYVEDRPGNDLRVVRGYECTAEALKVYGSACPDLPRSALEDVEWESVRLWTRRSVTMARIGLVAAWLLFVCGLIMAVGAIIAGRSRDGGRSEN